MSAPAGPGAPRVVLVDDHGLFRSGVRAELADQVEVVGEADDVAPAIELIERVLPDVVLLDVHLPGGGGHAVITEVKKTHPEVKFLALSASDAPEDVIAVIRAGARGYVTKTISTADLADAIRRVAGGDAVFSHRLAGFVLDAFAAAPTAQDVRPSFDSELDQLTTREREVLRLIAQGYTYKEVARELYHLGQDGREPRLLGAAQTAALLPPPANPLGRRAPPHVTSRPQTRSSPGRSASLVATRSRSGSSRVRIASISAAVCARTWPRQALMAAIDAETGGGSMARIRATYRSSSVPSGPREPWTRSAWIFCRSNRRSDSGEATTRRDRSQAELVSQRGLGDPSGFSAGTM